MNLILDELIYVINDFEACFLFKKGGKYFEPQSFRNNKSHKRIEEFGKWLEEDAEEQEQIINKEENIESGVKEIDITEELKKID